ncbi:MAG: DUF3048 domain-containing protein [Eubacteriales bacterium]|nr:DUF3048 domain-containing protein [Eubacteriales bacterium]
MIYPQLHRLPRSSRLAAACICALAFALLLGGCSAATAPAASASPSASAMPVVTLAPTPTPEPTPTPTPEPKNRSLTSGRVIPEGTPLRPFVLSIDNAAGAKPQTSLMEADIVYEFLMEQAITRFQALYNDTYPLYAGPLRSTRYYVIDMVQEWDCMFLHEGYVVLKKPYRRLPQELITLYLPKGDFRGYSKNFYRTQGAYDDFETENGYKFRATEAGRGSVHALYYRIAALVNRYYGEHTAKESQRFLFLENITYETGKPFTKVTLSFDNKKDPNWIEFVYDAEKNRLFRFESGEESLTRTLIDHGDNYITEQMNVQNLIVQYVEYGSIKDDGKHRRTCEMIGSGKCDYFINGQHVTGTWSRPTVEDYTTYLLDDGSLVTLEPGNTWIAVHPSSVPVRVE